MRGAALQAAKRELDDLGEVGQGGCLATGGLDRWRCGRRGVQMLGWLSAVGGMFRVSDWTLNRIDPDGLRYVATVSVWAHWCIGAACLGMLVYRPWYGAGRYVAFAALLLALLACNGYVHYRLASKRTLTWRWVFATCVADVSVVTGCLLLGGGFDHYFFHLLYYPALAGFAVFFTSFRLNMAFVTAVACVYLAVCLTVGDGIDLAAREEKPLFVRVLVMYAVAASVNLVSRFERIRWRAAVERERELHRQRVEVSQNIHDTTAQWAYMVGLGIEGAMELVDESQAALAVKLRLAADLSRSAMWELRHPIDGGQVFRGEVLSDVLEAHAATFSVITSVPAEFVLRGAEPELSTIAKSLLFSIAHNAMTNVLRHAQASRVVVDFGCVGGELRLLVSDDGRGLPKDYEARGHGFRNMRADAERIGGRLVVQPGGAAGDTVVGCVVPYPILKGGD